MRVSELDTPALIIDLDIMERNLARVADYAKSHGLRLRPHTKTHKIPALGRKQVELGAAGLTVAKVGEAEVMLASDTPDMLVAYPVIGRKKLERLMDVARRTKVTVSLDSVAAARQLSDAAREGQVEIRVLVETDVGLGRVGVRPGDELRQLAQSVARLPWLAVEGIAFYPGHIKDMGEDGQRQLDELCRLTETIVREFRADGLPLNVVSGGSTPTLFESHRVGGMNEIRPGTYIFNDRNTWAVGACALEDCAASIVATVVSTARPGFLIIDGGSKTFFSDRLVTTGEATFGYVREAPEAIFYRMNEEHGYLDMRKAPAAEFQVGDRLRVIPNHICVAMNLHEQVYGIRGDEVVETWKVEGRGKLQ